MIEWRNKRIELIHPGDSDRRVLEDQLRKLGTRIATAWPLPGRADSNADGLIIRLAPETEARIAAFLESFAGFCIAAIDADSPTAARVLAGCNLHGVMVRPHLPGALLSHLTVASGIHAYAKKLQTRVAHLETNLRARRVIEKAIRQIEVKHSLNEDQAYELLRDTAMRCRLTISALAEALQAGQDLNQIESNLTVQNTSET